MNNIRALHLHPTFTSVHIISARHVALYRAGLKPSTAIGFLSCRLTVMSTALSLLTFNSAGVALVRDSCFQHSFDWKMGLFGNAVLPYCTGSVYQADPISSGWHQHLHRPVLHLHPLPGAPQGSQLDERNWKDQGKRHSRRCASANLG